MIKFPVKLLFLSLLVLCTSSVITQLVMFREFLSVISANELLIGVFLSSWLFLTGLGALIGKKLIHKLVLGVRAQLLLLSFFHVITGFLVFFMLHLTRLLRAFFPLGELLGLTQVFFLVLVLLAPFCLLSGFLIVYASNLLSTSKNDSVSETYFIDNLGDVLGGLVFSFVLVNLFNDYQVTILVLVLNLVLGFFITRSLRRKKLSAALLMTSLLCLVLFFVDLNLLSIEALHPGERVLSYAESVYGSVLVTRVQDQINFYENNMPLFSSNDVVSREEGVHYALLQRDETRNVLLISGGVTGAINEVLKHGASLIDYVELNPALITLTKRFTNNLERLPGERVFFTDARLFLNTFNTSYDAILSFAPDPETISVNRYYTTEFFGLVKERLRPGGVFSLGLSYSPNYLSRNEALMIGSVYKALKQVFTNVVLVPGEELYLISSDAALSVNITGLITRKRVQGEYVNTDYLDQASLDERSKKLKELLEGLSGAWVNTDFHPVAYVNYLLTWFEKLPPPLVLFFFLGALVVVLFFYAARRGKEGFTVLSTGFCASSLTTLLLIGFQVVRGGVYYEVSLLVTAFMTGLGVGTLFATVFFKRVNKKLLVVNEVLIVLFVLFFVSLVFWVGAWNDFGVRLFFLACMLCLGLLVSAEFILASRLVRGGGARVLGELYSCDLIGASVGSFTTSVFLFPFLGLTTTCLILILIKTINAIKLML